MGHPPSSSNGSCTGASHSQEEDDYLFRNADLVTSPTKAQGAGQASGTATFKLGGVAVTFTWKTNQENGGVDITATPEGCKNCEWAQTVSGTGVEGGTKADIQKVGGQESDAQNYPFAAHNEIEGQLYDQPSRSGSPAKLSFVSTMGTSDGKTFHPDGSLSWGFSKSAIGRVRFDGVRQATAGEQTRSLATWSARTGMKTSP